MYDILEGLRVVEGSSFVAGPVCGQHFLELGAEVIRFDDISGGLDSKRWPIDATGTSLFWEGLNKGKKSIALDLASPQGRELSIALITAPGKNAGLFTTNFPVDGFLSYENLVQHRSDLVVARIMGWADGRNAVDYTINAATGLPLMTGPAEMPANHPVNHVLPAWDLITGTYAAFSLVAAERRRRKTGIGGEIRVPLADIAATTMGHLGWIAEATLGAERPRDGNDLYGAFGRDFETVDGKRMIIVAITKRQWTSLVSAFNISADVAKIEEELGISFDHEGQRYLHRDRLFSLVQDKIGRMSYAKAVDFMDETGLCWETYRSLHDAITMETGLVACNPVFSQQSHPSGHRYPTSGAPGSFSGLTRGTPPPAPRLGEHTELILADTLGLSSGEIARLHDRGIVASATPQ
ncbi:CoA transferase [Sedimentitalea sp.]|uniref:CoA transferase n=1 Tax=Sedimentitalea sp. TaxID=2048915 RepID=UPI003297FC2D